MKSHGQFCSIARSLDLLGERWTLLVVRELLMGSTTFGEVRRGIPRISKTMLAARLKELVDAGVVAREAGAGGPSYRLTEAGRELEAVVGALGVWGQRWLPRHLDDEELDVDALVWDMHRRVRAEALPREPVVVGVHVTDLRRSRPRWLLVRAGEVSLCATNPGFAEALKLTADRRTLVGWWRGDVSFAEARRRGLALDGPAALVRAFPGWFDRYLFAEVPPARSESSARI
jgi:DNA-binding HxlR family transcriptional regulator